MHLDPEQVKGVARGRKYDDVFYKTLGKIERNAEAGKLTIEPLEYLRTGRIQKGTQLTDWQPQQGPPPMSRQVQELLTRPQRPGVGSSVAAVERRINQMAAALKPVGKSQDMQSEEERHREYDREM